MALLITKKCINCDMCEPDARMRRFQWAIISTRLTAISDRMRRALRDTNLPEGVPDPQTIVKDPQHVETEEQLWDKFVLCITRIKFNILPWM